MGVLTLKRANPLVAIVDLDSFDPTPLFCQS